MATELERRLRDAFHDDAARARVVHRDRPADPAPRPSPVARPPARPPWRAVAVAATVAVLAAAGVAVIRDSDRDTGVATMPSRRIELFADVPPDATTPLPPGPIRTVAGAQGVWTGDELIVWGEPSAPDESPPPEGAAFHAATGRWRTIAPAPVDRGAAVAWTGSEMLVLGAPRTGGAAYDPDTDTWRRLPGASTTAAHRAVAVWAGDELVVLGGLEGIMDAGAYDPAAGEMRQLAETDGYLVGPAVWTGTSVLTVLDVGNPGISGPDDGGGRRLAVYDLATDTWQVDEEARYATVVGVPGADDGVTRTVLAVPVETGAPVDLLDADGNRIATLPAHPVELDGSTTVVTTGLWLGDEAVFWIRGGDDRLLPSAEPWALHPETGTWRPLPDEVGAAVHDSPDSAVVAAGDVLLASDGTGGIAYRAPTRSVPAGRSTRGTAVGSRWVSRLQLSRLEVRLGRSARRRTPCADPSPVR